MQCALFGIGLIPNNVSVVCLADFYLIVHQLSSNLNILVKDFVIGLSFFGRIVIDKTISRHNRNILSPILIGALTLSGLIALSHDIDLFHAFLGGGVFGSIPGFAVLAMVKPYWQREWRPEAYIYKLYEKIREHYTNCDYRHIFNLVHERLKKEPAYRDWVKERHRL